jgi:hypothetical protein
MCCFPMLRLMAVIRHVNVRLLHPFGLLENFLRHAMYSHTVMTASQKMPRNARGVGSSCKRSGRFGLLIIADFAISKH